MRDLSDLLLPFPSTTAVRQQLVIGAITVIVAGGAILYAGVSGIGLLYLLSFTVGVGLFAYRFPVATLVLWAIIASYSKHKMGAVSIAGGVDARATDPILLGMVVALVFATLLGDKRVGQALAGPCLMWALLIAWMGFQIVRSAPGHGIVSSLGEFRSTFQAILVLPYIVVFVRSRPQQRRLFQALSLLAIVFVIAALVNGGMNYDFTVSRWTRWMIAQVNLALVLSMAGWYVARQTGYWTGSGKLFFVLLFASLVLIVVCNHRSVWLAGAGVLACLAAFRLISVRAFLSIAVGFVLAGVAITIFAADLNLIEFLHVRMRAFTSFRDDPTASWRFQVWTATLDQIKASPIVGKGLGSYFNIPLLDGRNSTTPPHNLYMQLAYQLGLTGLALFVGVIVGAFRSLLKAYLEATDVHTCVLSMYAIVALAGGCLFYVAYNFEPFTWLFVGLGLAAALTHSATRTRRDNGSP